MTKPDAPADSTTVRKHNLRLVLGSLLDAPGSRAELSVRTGLTKATVSSLADALIAQGILQEAPPEIIGPGRPARLLSISPAGPVSIGVEVNVDYTSACSLDLMHDLHEHIRIPIDNRAAPLDEIVAGAAGAARAILDKLDRPVLGVGWAVPAVVAGDGTVLRAPNLPQLTGAPAARLLTADLGLSHSVVVDNEANLAALAELRSQSGTGNSFVYVSGEIGVGAGLVIDGEIFRGHRGFGGELGHVVVERDGPPCACGGRGCVEQYAGQEVLLRAARCPDVDALVAALDQGLPEAQSAVSEAGAALGVGLASMLNVIDVPLVVLGGLYSRLFTEVAPPLVAELSSRALSSRYGSGRVERSSVESAAVQGAAGLVLDRALRDPGVLTAYRPTATG